MIEFIDVTGAVLKRPGEHFFKMDSISDEAIQGYLDRGAELVDLDRISHANALKIKTAGTRLRADEALSNVPAEKELEDLGIARLRQTRQATADKAREADELADVAVVKSKTPKIGRPKGKK